MPPDSVFFGEISLSGSVRPVAHAGARLKEAAKLGFGRAMAPGLAGDAASETAVMTASVTSLAALVADIAAPCTNATPRPR